MDRWIIGLLDCWKIKRLEKWTVGKQCLLVAERSILKYP